ncbi:hypothetical protein WA556_003322, partial [Blastocystis sp. ATCC 50177/Nand II]
MIPRAIGRALSRRGSRAVLAPLHQGFPKALQLVSVTSVRLIQFNAMSPSNINHPEHAAAQPKAENASSLAEQTSKVSSFEEAIANIQDYQNRSLEQNLRSLMECGRYSPGVALISCNPLLSSLSSFLKYLNDATTPDQLASINLYIIIRAFWALPRIGCTYTSNRAHNSPLDGNCRIVDLLLSTILSHTTTLTTLEWATTLRALGKLQYHATPQQLNCILDGLMFYRDAFSLSELCDVAWALLRLKSGNAPATRAGLLGDDRLFALFKRVEDLVL